MDEQYIYSMVIFVQPGEGAGGLSNHKVIINHRIDSYEILDDIVGGITADLFPDGLPELPKYVKPVVVISWQLVTAKRRAATPSSKRNGT